MYLAPTTKREPLLLIEACKHNVEDAEGAAKACSACKKAIAGKIKVEPFKEVCDELDAFEGRFNGDPKADKGNLWTPYNEKFGFPFIGPHKPIKERCEFLVKEMKGHLAGLKSAFEAGACSCLGCCDPHGGPKHKCWFPMIDDGRR